MQGSSLSSMSSMAVAQNCDTDVGPCLLFNYSHPCPRRRTWLHLSLLPPGSHYINLCFSLLLASSIGPLRTDGRAKAWQCCQDPGSDPNTCTLSSLGQAGLQVLPQHLDEGLLMHSPVQLSIGGNPGLKKNKNNNSLVPVVLGDLRCFLDSAFPLWER